MKRKQMSFAFIASIVMLLAGLNGLAYLGNLQQSVAASDQRIHNFAIPMEGGSSGVEGAAGGGGVLNSGSVYVSYSQFSGETDSMYGSNAWSVQLNTNTFTGSNGQTDWVQFVYWHNVNNGSGSSPFSMFAIWEIDLSQGIYGYHAYDPQYLNNVPVTLSTSTTIQIDASASGGNLNAELIITTSSGSETWDISYQDVYGLSGHWSTVSGAILGGADGSTANFNSPTQESTQLTASSSTTWGPYAFTDYTTGEQNNLNQGSVTTQKLFEPMSDLYLYLVTTQSSN